MTGPGIIRRRGMVSGLVGALAGLALPARADLKSWLHGSGPAPQPKAAPPAQLAVVSHANGVAADAQVDAFLRTLAAAIKARDGDAMRPLLSERYAVADLPAGAKPADFFVQAVERMPGPLEMVVQAIVVEAGTRVVKVELRLSNDRQSSKTFRFDAAGRLLASDLFRLQVQGG